MTDFQMAMATQLFETIRNMNTVGPGIVYLEKVWYYLSELVSPNNNIF